MKIGFFTSFYMPMTGGAEILLDRLIRTMADRGHEVALVSARGEGFRNLPYPAYPTLKPFSKRHLLHHTFPVLYRAWLRHRFDLVHCQGEYHPAHVMRTLHRMHGVPYVVRPTGGGFTMARGSEKREARIRRALLDASRVIAQGAFLKERIMAFGCPGEKIVTIPNGVDPDELPDPGTRPQAAPYILFTGGLNTVKGYDILLDAFSRITGKLPGHDLILAGPDKRLDDFRDAADGLGLPTSRVRYLGCLGRRELGAWLHHADMYVCPFRASPFSNANLEAMACGIPVIATAVDGNPEQLDDGKAGILVPPGDPAALAETMQKVGRDRHLRDTLAERAKARANNYTWAGLADRYEELYDEIAGGG